MARESTGKTNWKGPVVGGIAAVAHFFLWLAIASGLKRWTGNDQWEYGLGGFNLVASPLLGMMFGVATSERAKPVKFMLPPSLAGLYCFMGAMFGVMVPDSALLWLILGVVGIPLTVVFWLWCRHLPGLTKADLAEIASKMPPQAKGSQFRLGEIGCLGPLAMAAIGVGCAVIGGALSDPMRPQNTPLATRVLLGGIFLVLSSFAAACAIVTIRTKKAPAHLWPSSDEPWWSGMRQVDRSEAPGRYRLWLGLWLILAIGAAVSSVAGFLGCMEK